MILFLYGTQRIARHQIYIHAYYLQAYGIIRKAPVFPSKLYLEHMLCENLFVNKPYYFTAIMEIYLSLCNLWKYTLV